MSLIEVRVFVVYRFGLGFLVYIFTLLVFKFMAHEGAAHVLRGVFRVYYRLIPSLAIASGGIGGSYVNNAPEAARHESGILQALMFVAARLPLIRPAR